MKIDTNTGGNAMASNAKDVAKLAGVSMATVSRVVNGAENVSAETRARVLRAISQLDYRTNMHAAELGRKNIGRAKSHDMNKPFLAAVSEEQNSNSRTLWKDRQQKMLRLSVLKDRYSRVRREVDELSRELDRLKRTL
jgi:transcriptional regulator with XRE-family HTH domain